MSDDWRPTPNAGQRKNGEAPWCWQTKAALWRIRVAFDESTFLDQALAVYLVLCELASDEQSETFATTRRKIAERSGVSIRRVSEILARFKSLSLLAWQQNYLEGTKELAPSTYTLMSCTPCTTSCTPRSRLGTEDNSGNCTVVKQSPEKSPLTKGGSTPRLVNQEQWKLDKDKTRLEMLIREQREKSKPDQDIIAAWRSELKTINDELRRRGQSAKLVTTADDAPRRNDRNAGTNNANGPGMRHEELNALMNRKRQFAAAQPNHSKPTPPVVAPIPFEQRKALWEKAKASLPTNLTPERAI